MKAISLFGGLRAFVLASAALVAGYAHSAADDLADSVIGRVAAATAPGQFSPIETRLPPGVAKLSELFRVRVEDGRRLSIDGWTDSAHWDPKRKRTFFIGMRKYKKFISYDAPSNQWQELGWAGEPPPKFEKFGHVYGRTALDWKRGHYYWLSPGNVLNRYAIDQAQWEAIKGVPISGYISMEWHETLDMLVAIKPSHEVVGFRDTNARTFGKSGVHGYHSLGRYNRTRGDMLFAGGNNSPKSVSMIGRDGKVIEKRDAPFRFSIGNSSLTYDPVSGNYLLMRGKERRLYEYDPEGDEWRVAKDWSNGDWPFGSYAFYTPIVIDDLGVIFWQSEIGNYIYRHKSVFSSERTGRLTR